MSENDSEIRRGRPGRRSAADRTEAVLALIAGKASADTLAQRFGVSVQTVMGWRDAALAGIEAAMRRGSDVSPRERDLEREVGSLKEALTDTSIQLALIKQAIKQRENGNHPSRPPRSSR